MSKNFGSLREYETVFVLSPELGDDQVTAMVDRLKGVLEKMSAELLREDRWGKRKMAFEVKKSIRGNFILFHYVGKVGVVEELERIMRNAEHVVRFLTTVHGDVSDIDAKRAEVTKMLADRADEARQEAERKAREEAAAEEAKAPQEASG